MYAKKLLWGWFVESKDGKVFIESIEAHCAWCAKTEGVLEWGEQRRESMKGTGKFATKEDTEKMHQLAMRGWMPGEAIMVFSVGDGIRKDKNTVDAQKECHKLALAYGLPEIEGYYGMNKDGEFVET